MANGFRVQMASDVEHVSICVIKMWVILANWIQKYTYNYLLMAWFASWSHEERDTIAHLILADFDRYVGNVFRP